MTQSGQNALGNHGDHRGAAAIVDKNGKFVTALAAHRILVMHRALDPSGHFQQDAVADARAEGVIEILEVIDIEQ